MSNGYPNGYVKGVGPAAKPGTSCPCGQAAVAECQGCSTAFCRACWWKHRHTWTVQLQPLDDAVPDDVRVANALKTLLRSHKLKCIDVRQSAVGSDAEAEQEATK